MKKLFFVLIYLQFNFVFPKTSFPGFKAWLSPYRMALGGSGYLSFSPLLFIKEIGPPGNFVERAKCCNLFVPL